MKKIAEAKVLIHQFESSIDGKTKYHYMWIGPIDGKIEVGIELLEDEVFKQIPFKLMRMKNLDSRTAIFIRIDWKARIMRFFRKVVGNG